MRKTLLLLTMVATNVFAEDVSTNIIYKCFDPSGNVTYSNSASVKKDKKCSKTELATIDKQTAINKPTPQKSNESPLELVVPGITKPPIGLPKDNSKINIDPNVELIKKPTESTQQIQPQVSPAVNKLAEQSSNNKETKDARR